MEVDDSGLNPFAAFDNGLSEDEDEDDELPDSPPPVDPGGGPEDGSSEEEEEEEEEELRPQSSATSAEGGAELEQRAAGLSRELYSGYRVLRELMMPAHYPMNWPFMDAVDTSQRELWDYPAIVKQPVWLNKVRERLLSGGYDSLTALFRDLRLMLRNCYRYNGPQHGITRRALRLEQLMEQLIQQMEPDLRDQCTLEATEGAEAVVSDSLVPTRRSKRGKKPAYFSHVLHWVRGERAARDREYRRKKLELRKEQRERREERVLEWEQKLLEGHTGDRLRAMWELPQVAQFIHLSLRALNILEVPLYELERILLVPQSSDTLAMLMTSLLSAPLVRMRLAELPPMPYAVWTSKLAARTQLWYRAFNREKGDTQRLLETIGVDPVFWSVVGERNPFERRLFHQFSFYERVWMLKTLCDYLFHSHKSIQDCVMEATLTEPRETVVGRDRHGFEYLHFPQFLVQDVRLYRRRPWRAPPAALAVTAPARSPPRLVSAGQKWTKAKLRQLQRRLTELRRRHQGESTPRKGRRYTCLAAGGGTADSEESAGEAPPQPEEEADDEWEASPAKSARGKRRSRAGTATPSVSSRASSVTPAKRPRLQTAPAPATPADPDACQYCGLQIRSSRARNAHRCLQKQVAEQSEREADEATRAARISRIPARRSLAGGSESDPHSDDESASSDQSESDDQLSGSGQGEDETSRVSEDEDREEAKVAAARKEKKKKTKRSRRRSESEDGESDAVDEDREETKVAAARKEKKKKTKRSRRRSESEDGESDAVDEDREEAKVAAARKEKKKKTKRSRRRSESEDGESDAVSDSDAADVDEVSENDEDVASGEEAEEEEETERQVWLVDNSAMFEEGAASSWGEEHAEEEEEDDELVVPETEPCSPAESGGEGSRLASPAEDATESPRKPLKMKIVVPKQQLGKEGKSKETENKLTNGHPEMGEEHLREDLTNGEVSADVQPGQSPKEDSHRSSPSPSPPKCDAFAAKQGDSPVEDASSVQQGAAAAASERAAVKKVEPDLISSDGGPVPRSAGPGGDGPDAPAVEDTVKLEPGNVTGSVERGAVQGSAGDGGASGDLSAVSKTESGESELTEETDCDRVSPEPTAAEAEECGVKSEPDVKPAKGERGLANGTEVNSVTCSRHSDQAEAANIKEEPQEEPVKDCSGTGVTKSESSASGDEKPRKLSATELAVLSITKETPRTEIKIEPEQQDTKVIIADTTTDADAKPPPALVSAAESSGGAGRAEADKADTTDAKPPPALVSAAESGCAAGRAEGDKADTTTDAKPPLALVSAAESGCAAGRAEPAPLPVPEQVQDPDHLPSPDPYQFQLVAASFPALRQLIADLTSPEQQDSGKKKRDRQPECEVELRLELQKILEELQPLEAKISTSVRRMRKRLCQEWLAYINRPADFRHRGETVWADSDRPGRLPNLEPPPPPKPPTPPPPSEDELSCDEEGRRRQRSRRVKQKRPGLSQRAAERGAAQKRPRARQDRAEAVPQVSSRGRLRKVRKMHDFAYDEDDPPAAPPSTARAGASAQHSSEEEHERPPQRMRMSSEGESDKSSATVAGPSLAWNSELPLPRGRARGAPRRLAVTCTGVAGAPVRPGRIGRPRGRGSPLVRPVRPPNGERVRPLPVRPVQPIRPAAPPAAGKRRFVVKLGTDGRMFMESLSGGAALPLPVTADVSATTAQPTVRLQTVTQTRPMLVQPSAATAATVAQPRLVLQQAGASGRAVPVVLSVARPQLVQVAPPAQVTSQPVAAAQPAMTAASAEAGSPSALQRGVVTVVQPATSVVLSPPTAAAPAPQPAAPASPTSSQQTPAGDAAMTADIAAKVRMVMQQLQSMNVVLTSEKAQQVAVRILAEAQRKKQLAAASRATSAATAPAVKAQTVVTAAAAAVNTTSVVGTRKVPLYQTSTAVSPGRQQRAVPYSPRGGTPRAVRLPRAALPVPRGVQSSRRGPAPASYTHRPRQPVVISNLAGLTVSFEEPCPAAAVSGSAAAVAGGVALSPSAPPVPVSVASTGAAARSQPVVLASALAADNIDTVRHSAVSSSAIPAASAPHPRQKSPAKVQPPPPPPISQQPSLGNTAAVEGSGGGGGGATQPGKLVRLQGGGLGIRLATGAVVPLSAQQASAVKSQALKRKQLQAAAAAAAQPS